MEENLTLKDLIKIFKERIFLILSITCLAVLAAAGVSYYILTPSYETSTQILVNQERGTAVTYNNLAIETDLQLINTYSVIIKSPVILDEVVEQLNLDLTAKQLNEQITVSKTEDSQVFDVAVEYQDPQMAVDIANTTTQVFQEEIQTIMDINNITVLTPAVLDAGEGPVFPNPLLNMILAGVLGFLTGCGIALLLNYLDVTLKDEEDVIRVLDIPVIGVIAAIDEKEDDPGAVHMVLNRKEV